jgi:hypothetical protein
MMRPQPLTGYQNQQTTTSTLFDEHERSVMRTLRVEILMTQLGTGFHLSRASRFLALNYCFSEARDLQLSPSQRFDQLC